MAQAKTKHSDLGRRYASALFDLAVAEKSLDQTAKEFNNFVELVNSSVPLTRVVNSPTLSRREKQDVFINILERGKAGKLIQSFIGTLAKNNRLFALPAIARQFNLMVAEQRGEIIVPVRAARELTAEQQKDLKASLAKKTGKKISLDVSIDPELIAGIVVNIGSRLYDASLKSKLERMKLSLKHSGNVQAT